MPKAKQVEPKAAPVKHCRKQRKPKVEGFTMYTSPQEQRQRSVINRTITAAMVKAESGVQVKIVGTVEVKAILKELANDFDTYCILRTPDSVTFWLRDQQRKAA